MVFILKTICVDNFNKHEYATYWITLHYIGLHHYMRQMQTDKALNIAICATSYIDLMLGIILSAFKKSLDYIHKFLL